MALLPGKFQKYRNEARSWVLYSVSSGAFTRREGHGANLVILIDYRSDS